MKKKQQLYDCYTYSSQEELYSYGNNPSLMEEGVTLEEAQDFEDMVYECSDCTTVKIVKHRSGFDQNRS